MKTFKNLSTKSSSSSYYFANSNSAAPGGRLRVELLIKFPVEFKLQLWLRIGFVLRLRRGAIAIQRASSKENQTSFKFIQSCSTPCREKIVSRSLKKPLFNSQTLAFPKRPNGWPVQLSFLSSVLRSNCKLNQDLNRLNREAVLAL